MLECVIWLVIWAIVAAILLWAVEAVLGAFGMAVPGRIMTLFQVLVVLLVLLAFLNCLGVTSAGPWPLRRCP